MSYAVTVVEKENNAKHYNVDSKKNKGTFFFSMLTNIEPEYNRWYGKIMLSANTMPNVQFVYLANWNKFGLKLLNIRSKNSINNPIHFIWDETGKMQGKSFPVVYEKYLYIFTNSKYSLNDDDDKFL